LITPQFMRNEEFVERFKREARAAGRLRHPNVVDVTDFGFARAGSERVAYLVMEYLDGCTLGDVLSEEKTLPLEWVVDIHEQVCSAVHEAHQQGIVHRDLKPDNIWLEPNRLGGYRVKVLDFGIAKLAEVAAPTTFAVAAGATAAAQSTGVTDLEANTLLFASDNGDEADVQDNVREKVGSETLEESDTQLFVSPPGETKPAMPAPRARPDVEDGDGTLLFDRATCRGPIGGQTTSPAGTAPGTGLTRVGALMGTPLYMSPEQCRGAGSDTRSDIYSLGVIAYQMLAGAPPFTGETESIIRAHNETPPAPLRERSRKVPKRVAQVVMSALAKDPAERPQTAHAFASSLRAQADGIGSLYRRAFALYSEYFPKFLRLSLIAHLPVIVFTLLTISLTLSEKSLRQHGKLANVLTLCAIALVGLLQVVSYFVAGSAISGMTAIIVTQLQVAPLRPVQLRTVFAVLKRRWRPFLNTSIRLALRIMIGYVLLIIPGIVMQVRYVLWAPVVLMEGLSKKAALKRARELASRSWRTIIIVSVLQVLIPAVAGALVGRFSVSVNRPSGTHITVARNVYQQLSGLVNILVIPLMSIVPALLYLKMRQLGGETLSTALAQIEDLEGERTQWQQRMRSRLTMHTPQDHTLRNRPSQE
jgi:serine/threonine protein kinase